MGIRQNRLATKPCVNSIPWRWRVSALTQAVPPPNSRASHRPEQSPVPMRVRNSLKSAKVRDKNCRVVRRRGRVYVINKKNPRMKVRQG